MSETNKVYRNAGLYSFGDGFNILNSAPIDSRTFVNNITDIYDDANWSEIGVKPYPGLIVSSPSGDVKIYVGPVISKLEDVTNSEEQIGWRKKENWLDVNIPKINPSDAGRLLTIVPVQTGTDEETGNPIYKYEAQWADAPSGLPTINGASDANKVLQVNANGTGVTWVTVNTELMDNVTAIDLYRYATARQLKPGMKYRITNYSPDVNTNYSVTINNVEYNIGANTGDDVKFDIIVTASSTSTLFDDVELVAKAGVTPTFDYTKYEAKYDLFGNRTSPDPKYDYIGQDEGVIYYMKDQYGNEASYDFENIYYTNSGNEFHTFDGGSSGDLRQYGVIQNVRIKNPIQSLPGIIFDFQFHQDNSTEIINDVELNNCTGIYTTCASLRHAKISNSNNVSIRILYDDDVTMLSMPYPMFENLNICNNDNLMIVCDGEVLYNQFNKFGGFYVNNLNILPSITSKQIVLDDMASQIISIFKQGLIDGDVLNKMNIGSPDDDAWLWAVLYDDTTSNISRVILSQLALSDSSPINTPVATTVYDAILNASKNIRPFDIFNTERIWNLEIPHFQLTATSVYELGI